MKATTKRYLGDGVYAEHLGDRVVLTAENGLTVTNLIVLESEVYVALVQFVREMQRREDAHEEGPCS